MGCHPEPFASLKGKLPEGSGSAGRSFASLRMTVPVVIVRTHYRPMAHRFPQEADTSAVRQYIARLRGITRVFFRYWMARNCAPIHCAPTGYYRSWLLKLIIKCNSAVKSLSAFHLDRLLAPAALA